MYQSKFASEQLDLLFDAVLSLESREECYRFFEDLCTVNELNLLAQRFEVSLLLEQKKTYHEISQATSASTATISRINRCLEYGADGYKLALKRWKERSGGGESEPQSEDR